MFHVLTLTYVQPLDLVDQTRPAHLDWLKDEVERGRLLLAGRQEDQSGGVLITGDISTEDAEALIANDPYSSAGLVTYSRLSFNGGVRASGFVTSDDVGNQPGLSQPFIPQGRSAAPNSLPSLRFLRPERTLFAPLVEKALRTHDHDRFRLCRDPALGHRAR